MASRRFFGYDPYDYYYPSPSNYTYPYYHNPAAFTEFDTAQPAIRHPSPDSRYYRQRSSSARAPGPARNGGTFFFRDAESPEPVMRETLHPGPRSSRPISIPVVGPDPEPERKAAGSQSHAPAAAAAAHHKKRSLSAEEAAVKVQAAARGLLARRMMREVRAVEREAAVKVQAAARGLLARRMMREVRAVEREAEAVAARIAADVEALLVDPRGRVGVGEELMRLLFRLDAVRGVREYRRKVTKKVLALQDAIDALEAKPDQAAAESLAAEAFETEFSPQPGEQGVQIGSNIAPDSSAVEETAHMDMEVDGGRAEEADSAAAETIAAELVVASEQAAEADGEWEMVDDALAGENPPPKQQAAGKETDNKTEAAAGEEIEKKTGAATADGFDAKKVMEMMAALCEQSAQQCALIGALAERVDTLERAVRRMEEADRRQRRIKKIKKERKINSTSARSFYSD